MSKMPAPIYQLGPCPQCGATTESEATGMCTQSQDVTGEWTCAGEFDRHGRSVVPTPESLAAIDKWIDRQMVGKIY